MAIDSLQQTAYSPLLDSVKKFFADTKLSINRTRTIKQLGTNKSVFNSLPTSANLQKRLGK